MMFKAVLAAAVGAALAVTNDPINDPNSYWQLARAADNVSNRTDGVVAHFFGLVRDDAPSGQRVVQMELAFATPFSASQFNMLKGVSLGLMPPKMFCSTPGAPASCLPQPSDPATWPANTFYFSQATRKVLIPFSNAGTSNDNADFCRTNLGGPFVSVVKEFCKTKTSCDNLRWTSATYASAMPPQVTNTATDPDMTATPGFALTDLRSIKVVVGRGRFFRYRMNLQLPDNFFQLAGGQGDLVNDDYSLGLYNGSTRYLVFAMWQTTEANAVCPLNPREFFAVKHEYASILPWTSGTSAATHDQYSGTFLTVFAPTASPTKSPTSRPTDSPTLRPSTSPTRSPTMKPTRKPTNSPTARPTRSPTPQPTRKPTSPTMPAPTARPTSPTKAPTERPTRSPTPQPTNKPTSSPTERPTRSPTPQPTNRPTKIPTERPTMRPTTPVPSKAPTPFQCPVPQNWELCQRINTWYAFIVNNPQERYNRIKYDCQQNGCIFCDYGAESPSASDSCRPSRGGVQGDSIRYAKDMVCPADGSNPFTAQGCDLFPDCPTPEEMTACKQLNLQTQGREAAKCENGFRINYQGGTLKVGYHRCAWNNGLCRAVGPYYWAKKTVANIAGFFDIIKGCPYMS